MAENGPSFPYTDAQVDQADMALDAARGKFTVIDEIRDSDLRRILKAFHDAGIRLTFPDCTTDEGRAASMDAAARRLAGGDYTVRPTERP